MVEHSPTPDIILMVENALLAVSEYPTKNALRKSLPRQIKDQTFNTVLSYLEESGKILYDGRSIIYTGINNEKLRELIEKGTNIKKR